MRQEVKLRCYRPCQHLRHDIQGDLGGLNQVLEVYFFSGHHRAEAVIGNPPLHRTLARGPQGTTSVKQQTFSGDSL